MEPVQIIRTASGEELVVLTKADYDALLAAAAEAEEDAEDIALYDARKAALAAGEDAPLPEAVSRHLLKGHSRLKAIRLWRGLSQTGLSQQAGIGQGYLSDLESGRRQGGEDVMGKLSGLLDVPLAWLR